MYNYDHLVEMAVAFPPKDTNHNSTRLTANEQKKGTEDSEYIAFFKINKSEGDTLCFKLQHKSIE